MEDKFVVLQGATEAIAQVEPCLGGIVHRALEELVIVAPPPLGLVHGGIGIFKQRVDILTIFRKDADADAGCQDDRPGLRGAAVR